MDGAAAARKLLEPSNPAPSTAIVNQRESSTVNVSPNWPLAYEEGRWSGHAGSADSKPILSGKYAAQWVKRNGQWLIRSEVFVALGARMRGARRRPCLEAWRAAMGGAPVAGAEGRASLAPPGLERCLS